MRFSSLWLRRTTKFLAFFKYGVWVGCALAWSAAVSSTGRFLYVLNGGAQLEKYDSVSGKKLASYELASRTGELKLVPSEGPGAMDGCLAYQAIYVPAAARFYTVVPEQYRDKSGGTKDYRVLAFTVPGVHLVQQIGAGKDLGFAPQIESIVNKQPRFASPESPPPQVQLDISGFVPTKSQIGNQILERSGDSILLRLFDAEEGSLSIGVAHLASKMLTRLPEMAGLHIAGVHLTPGGSDVLVQQGKVLTIYDANKGVKQKDVSSLEVAGSFFLAISPNGKAIYHSDSGFKFIDLGMRFQNTPVTGREQTCLAFFFADI